MLIKAYNTLTDDIVKEIRAVEDICKEHDKLNRGMYLENSMNFEKEIKNTFLLYEDARLVSVLSMFIPTRNEAEISACTLPGYRSKGYFKALLSKAAEELNKYNVPDILFACETQSSDGKQVLYKLNAKYDFTEYSMKYGSSPDIKINRSANGISLYKPSIADLEKLITLSQAVFNDTYDEARGLILSSLECKNREQYIGLINNEYIGMCSIYLEESEAVIFGFGIDPQYQGKGFGKELLGLMIDNLHGMGISNITLEVDSLNDRAFSLYRKYGFEIEASFDYYRKPVSEVI